MGNLTGPAIDILKDMIAGGVGPLTLTKAAVDAWNNYSQAREVEGLIQFVEYLGAKVGDIQQMLSDPYLQTVEGQRFAHKIFAAAVDARVAEKREVFANAFINGVRNKEISDLDRLRFVDILISLSAASLARFAEIYSRCDPMFDRMKNDWESMGMWVEPQTGREPPPDSKAEGLRTHFDRAAVSELQAAGLFTDIRLGQSSAGHLQVLNLRNKDKGYYTGYTRSFGRFISAPMRD